MTLKDALASALAQLTAAHVGSPRLNAETLFMFTLSCDRAYLYAHPERILTSEEYARLDRVIAERSRGVPAQYIIGHQEFWGLNFIVTPDVLIPRPETEHLIEIVLPLARQVRNPRIVDVGTGSGCIAVVLAKELPVGEIHATDISAPALEIARANAARNGVADRVQFHYADLLAQFEPDSCDFVVSNPPYVGDAEEDEVQLEVRKFEPRQAVFAGPTGMEVIARLVPMANLVLKPGGWLLLEISGSIAAAVRHELANWSDLRITADLQGIPRVACARKTI
jgi:release factor glutamine methyltransferase